MKISLVLPPYNLMKQGYGSKRLFIRAGFFPPLGVGYIASPLLKAGHEVKIIDSSPLNYQNEDILNDLKIFNPDLIGISSLTASAKEAYSLVGYLRKHFPKTPIIFGGFHASCFPEEIFKEALDLDCLVYGEGEATLLKIVNSIAKNGEIDENIPGTWVKKNGKIIKNPPAELVEDLDQLLPPAYELYGWKLYRPLPLQYKKMPVANMLTSRGCPWRKCTFCFSAGRASQKYRRHSPERVVSEIKNLVENFGIKEIAFWDDNFLVNEKWVFEFCDLLDKNGLKLPWSANGRVNTVTKLMLERAKKSGLWNVFYGFETGNDDLLVRIQKGATLEQARQATKWATELGMDVRGSFMLGLPGETPEKALKTIEFAKEIDIPFAQFLLTFPEYGTALYDDALAHGQIFKEYKGRTTPTYVSEGYKNPEEVREMQKLAYRRFYFRPSFFWKHLKRLKSWDIIKQYIEGIKLIIGLSS
ncbi:MAG: radical SAM protein [bacterium]|nr:radical SAM protein [bacterium]